MLINAEATEQILRQEILNIGKDGDDFYLTLNAHTLLVNSPGTLRLHPLDSIQVNLRLKGGSRAGQHQIQTVHAQDLQPWEGIITAENGTAVHLRKHLPRGRILKELVSLNLTLDNLAIVYTSAYMQMLDLNEEEKEQEMEQLILQVADFAEDWQIIKMDQTPRNDIIVAVQETDTADAIIEAGNIRINTLRGSIPAPTGPVVEEAEFNYKRWSLRCHPPLDMNIQEIESYLIQLNIRPREFIIETKDKVNVPCGGLQIFAQFNNTNQALSFKRKHTINGKRIYFRHQGLLTCEKCNGRGHTEERCAQVQRAKARNKKRKEAARKKRPREQSPN